MAAMWLFALDPTFSGRCCWPGRVRIRLCGIQACGKALNGIPPEGQGVWTREGGRRRPFPVGRGCLSSRRSDT